MRKCFSFFRGKALALMIASIILVLLASGLNLFQPVIVQEMILCTEGMMSVGAKDVYIFGILVTAGAAS